MHQTMEIYMARKKRVQGYYNPDSYRVFDETVSDGSLGNSKLNQTYLNLKRQPLKTDFVRCERRNHPHPTQAKFLRTNVMMLNEPVCVVAHPTKEKVKWWHSVIKDEPLTVPKMTRDTTQRADYTHPEPVENISRHSSNHLNSASKGILPVALPKTHNDSGDLLLEKISYFHNFDSRRNPAEPIRGKLHGSFVWDLVVKDQHGNDIVESPWAKRDIVNAKAKAVVSAANYWPTKDVQNGRNKTPQSRSRKHTVTVKDKRKSRSTSIPPIDGLPAP